MNTLFDAWKIEPPKNLEKEVEEEDDDIQELSTHEVVLIDSNQPKKVSSSAPVHPFFQPRRKQRRESDEVTVLSESTRLNDISVTGETTITRPSTKVRVDPENMHPFFAKRTKSEPIKRPAKVEAETRICEAPWPKFQHTRGEITHRQQCMGLKVSVAKRLETRNVAIGSSAVERFMKCTDHHTPQQQKNCIYEPSDSNSKHEPNQNLWLSAYSPVSVSDIQQPNAILIKQWLEKRIEDLRKQPIVRPKKKRKKQDDDLDGFIVDGDVDDAGDVLPNNQFLILTGETSSGKTATVYAAARELDAYVFEVNPSQRRSSKDLVDLLDGVGQSHLVHSVNRSAIVLVEEVDVLFEDEGSFWSGLMRFAELSRRPVVLTCNDQRAIPAHVAENSVVAAFQPFSQDFKAEILEKIASAEGHTLHSTAKEYLSSFDLKHSISSLQFLSNGPNTMSVDSSTLSSAQEDSELLSAADVCQSQVQSAFAPESADSTDRLLSYTYPDGPFNTRPYPFEFQPWQEIAAYNHKESINTKSNSLREALYFLSYGGGKGIYNSIDFAQGGDLGSDIVPYVKIIAKADKAREEVRAERMAQLGASRSTRRSYNSMGIPERHFDCDMEDLDHIIALDLVNE